VSPSLKSLRRQAHDKIRSVRAKRFVESFIELPDQTRLSYRCDTIAPISGRFHEFLGLENNVEVGYRQEMRFFFLAPPLACTAPRIGSCAFQKSADDKFENRPHKAHPQNPNIANLI
jgi:hypothetical protein